MEKRKRKRRRFGAADQAVVVKALLGGAKVAEAARRAGFATQTLYDARGRCPVFRAAWQEAVEESGRPLLVAPRGGRRWQARRQRRNQFTRARKQRFLEHFAATCDATASAEEAGICTSTVYTHLRSDPAFAAGWQDALAQGYRRLEALALAQRLAALEKIAVRGDKEVARNSEAAAEFERAIHLLREHKRGLAGVAKGGPTLGKWSFDDAFEALEKRLAAFGLRVESGERAPGDETGGGANG